MDEIIIYRDWRVEVPGVNYGPLKVVAREGRTVVIFEEGHSWYAGRMSGTHYAPAQYYVLNIVRPIWMDEKVSRFKTRLVIKYPASRRSGPE